MTEITQAEWERRVKALREAEAACVLPVGTRVQVRGSLEIGTRRGVVKDAGTADVAVQLDGASLLTVYGFDDIEVIDEPEWPLWLGQGVLVVVPGDGRWSGTAVGDPLPDGQIAVALHPTGEMVKYRAADLKPYVPRFEPGDRVVLATTGDVGEVAHETDDQSGTVGVTLSAEAEAAYVLEVAAHLLTKIGEQDD